MTPAPVVTLASPATRLVAHLLDHIFSLLATIFLALFMALSGSNAPIVGILVLSHLLVGLYFWSQGTTPGKRTLGLYVYSARTGQRLGFWPMVLRETVGKWLSGAFAGLGYLWILFDSHSQGWHDKLVDSIVLHGSGGL